MDKKLDAKGRWRNKTTSFMMSPEERADLDIRVSLSGLTKQEYMVRRLLERDIIVQPNSRIYKALRNQMFNWKWFLFFELPLYAFCGWALYKVFKLIKNNPDVFKY